MNFTARVRPSPLEESYVEKVMLLKTFEQGTPYRFSYEFDRDLECNDDEQWFISIRNVYFSPSVRKDPAHLPFLSIAKRVKRSGEVDSKERTLISINATPHLISTR